MEEKTVQFDKDQRYIFRKRIFIKEDAAKETGRILLSVIDHLCELKKPLRIADVCYICGEEFSYYDDQMGWEGLSITDVAIYAETTQNMPEFPNLSNPYDIFDNLFTSKEKPVKAANKAPKEPKTTTRYYLAFRRKPIKLNLPVSI